MSLLPHFRTWAVLLLCALTLLVTAQEEKRLTVYGPQATYAAAVRDRNNAEYADLLDIAGHLGSAAGKAGGNKFALRFGESNCEFRAGKNKAKIDGKNIDLGGPAIIEQGILWVPVKGLPALFGKVLGEPVEYREISHRLIVGAPIGLSAELRASPQRLLLHFSRPVNPRIASEPGRLRLSFVNDPVVAQESTQNFGDKLIPSATYSEATGAPVLTVAGSAPLIATFSDGGKTITIEAAPQAAVEKPPAPATAPPPAAATPQAAPSQPATATAPSRPRFMVVIDPAHGGDDRGAVLEAGFNEKELTLLLARKLRAALDRAGIPALLLRDGDVTVSEEQRAIAANTARAALYIGVHAGSVGRGVRIYTARMNSVGVAAGAMTRWNLAQVSYLDRSRELADTIAAQLARASVDHAEATAQLQPLPHLAIPAVVVEVLPDGGKISSLQSAEYQQKVCAALADGIAADRSTLEASK